MTKEQEEAIEILNKFKNNEMQRDKLEISRDGGWKIGDIYKLLELNPAIETVLSMLKEKDKEIETLKRDFKIVDQECSRLERKEAKQDKIIDLMAERIEWLCKRNGILLDREHNKNFTQEDIKQYFERKVKKCTEDG